MTRFAVLVIVCGAVLVAGPVFGFSTFAADRGVNIETALQEEAFLGVALETYDDTPTLDSRDDEETEQVVLGSLSNNINEDVAIDEIVVVSAEDGEDAETVEDAITIETPDEGSSIGEGDTQDVIVVCDSGENLGERDITFQVSASGETTAVSSVVVDGHVEIDIQCQRGGGGGGGGSGDQFDVSSVATGETVNEAVIEFENQGDEFTVAAISLDDATSATELEGERSVMIESDTDDGTLSQEPWTVGGDDSRAEFDGNERVEIAAEDSATITISEFDVDMRGEEFEITLESQTGNADDQTLEIEMPE